MAMIPTIFLYIVLRNLIGMRYDAIKKQITDSQLSNPSLYFSTQPTQDAIKIKADMNINTNFYEITQASFLQVSQSPPTLVAEPSTLPGGVVIYTINLSGEGDKIDFSNVMLSWQRVSFTPQFRQLSKLGKS